MSARLRNATLAVIAVTMPGCAGNPQTTLERLTEARRLSADLLVQFTEATDAANRAVMADSDEESTAFAREATMATESIQKDVDSLGPLLTDLRYSGEADLLNEFKRRFAEYHELDQSILGLAVENTNNKAQRLSFGPAQEAADSFSAALDTVRKSAGAADRWQVEALAATAVAAVREIQVLQAPHIAEADDAEMTRMEKQMMGSEATARRALETLTGLVSASSRPLVAAASATLDKFMNVHAQIIVLSRRNSEVRSLALSLGRKRMLTGACDETLRALQDALAKRGFTGTR